jgi:hypothetical protein
VDAPAGRLGSAPGPATSRAKGILNLAAATLFVGAIRGPNSAFVRISRFQRIAVVRNRQDSA